MKLYNPHTGHQEAQPLDSFNAAFSPLLAVATGWRENLLGIPAPAPCLDQEADNGGFANPPSVIRGVKRQTYSLDWLRVVAKKDRMTEGASFLRDFFGEPSKGKGLHGLSCGLHFGSEVRLAYPGPHDYCTGVQGPAEHVIIEIPGTALHTLPFAKQMEIAMFFMCRGWHCTRFDLAFDFHAERLDNCGVINAALKSLRSGELVRARIWEPKEIMNGGEYVSRGALIGRRGSLGSGRFVRIYDKGLESMSKDKTAIFTPGQWERWEVEFTGTVAHDTLTEILKSKDRFATLRAVAFGAIEFRKVSTLADHRSSRRELVPWYEYLLNHAEGFRARQPEKQKSLDSWAHWYRTSALPRPASYAAAVGVSLPEFLARVVGDVQVDAQALTKSAVGAAVCDLYGQSFNVAHSRLGNHFSLLDSRRLVEDQQKLIFVEAA